MPDTTTIETIGDMEMLVHDTEDLVVRIALVRAEAAESGQVSTEQTTSGHLSPPYQPDFLAKLPERSSILPQCIAALSAGKYGYGFSLPPVGFDPKTLAEDVLAERLVERERIRRWFDHSAGDLSWFDLQDRTSRDEDTVGWGAWELVPDTEGKLSGLEHAKARTLRLMPQDAAATEVTRWRLTEDGSEWEEVKYPKRLRLIVQLGSQGKKAYFKEPGDPRAISRTSGKVLQAKPNPTDSKQAAEMIFKGAYNPAGEYPLPRWIGAMAAVGGSFAAEQRNLAWFANPLPVLMLLVSGGLLGKEAHEYIAQKLQEVRKDDKVPGIVIVEAKAKGEGGGRLTDVLAAGAALAPTLEVIKLNELSPNDGQYQVFDGNSRDKVRSACGVPALFTAESQDYTRATAVAALQVFEQGTAAPARTSWDTIINRHVMPRIDAKWWSYRSNGPSLTSIEDVALAAEALAKLGSGSSNFGAELMSKALGAEVPKTDQPWGDLPFALVQVLANQGLLEVMQQDRLKRAVTEVVEQLLVKAAEGEWGSGE